MVAGVLILGIALFFILQKPYSVCDSQIEVFQKSQVGFLSPGKGNKGSRLPRQYDRYIEACRVGNSSGACYEYFDAIRKMLKNLSSAPDQCLNEMASLTEVKVAMLEAVDLLVRLAWGDKPPQPGIDKQGWLETTDIHLFCAIKSTYVRAFSEEAWNEYRSLIYKKLPGEAAQFDESNKCLNCDHLKPATLVLTDDEIWVRSLFSVRCDQY